MKNTVNVYIIVDKSVVRKYLMAINNIRQDLMESR